LLGSSYLELPRWLQWMTGNIGFHHIHHLAPRIPNYRLEDCYRGATIMRQVTPLNFRTALRASTLTLWDEAAQKLVRFSYVHCCVSRDFEKIASDFAESADRRKSRAII